MKIVVEREQLAPALARLVKVTGGRETIPILTCVGLRAEGANAIRLLASNLDAVMEISVEAEIARAGETALPARPLAAIAQKLPEGARIEIALEDGEANAAIRSGRARFALPAAPLGDFPVLTMPDDAVTFEMEGPALAALLRRVHYAQSTEEARYYLNGTLLRVADRPAGKRLGVAATDGHRAARAEMPLPEGAAGLADVILPRQIVAQLADAAEKAERIGVQAAATLFGLRWSGGALRTKLVDGNFPDIDRVIPPPDNPGFAIEVAPLRRALDLCASVLDGKSSGVTLETLDGGLQLAARGSESGEAEHTLDALADSGLSIGFNWKYLKEAAEACAAERIRIEFADANSPARIEPADADGGTDPAADFVTVVMPMRV